MEKSKDIDAKIAAVKQPDELSEEALEAVSGGYLYEQDLKYPVGTIVDIRYQEPGKRRHITERGVIEAIIRTHDTSCQYLIRGERIGLIAVDESGIEKVY